jgi:hypothetical protein
MAQTKHPASEHHHSAAAHHQATGHHHYHAAHHHNSASLRGKGARSCGPRTYGACQPTLKNCPRAFSEMTLGLFALWPFLGSRHESEFCAR